ncbi:MAG TPA: lysylphosphatidylglycerol synthase transmembrane domain-containing protein [Solirubrobacteraceae bacterium]|nr:lysylphosphatidylglycerol synthase transmembrane domain-containing protein [Solirubrobacteraceae bacterium]
MELTSRPRPQVPRARGVAIRIAIGAVSGAVLVGAFLMLVNVGAVFHRLAHLKVGFALMCGAAFLGAYVVRALRWRWLLRPCCRVPAGRAIAIYQVATFLNWLLPVRGGELAKSLLLRRTDGVAVSQSLATVTMDKTMDLLPAVGLLALIPFVHIRLSRPLWLLLLSAMVVVAAAGVILALTAWRRDRAMALLNGMLAIVLPARIRSRAQPFMAHFLDTLLSLIRHPRVLLVAASYTAVALCLDALFCLLAFRAVAAAVSVPVVLYGYTFYNLAYILPTPPGQIGSNELVGLVIFSGMFGLGRSEVGAMFLFSHPWTAALMTASGLVSLSLMGLTLGSTLRMSRQREMWGDP